MFSHTGHVMTLANSIIGVGILAMPFCFQKCGIVLAIVLLIISNWITRICCHYLIKCSLLTRRKSFEFLGLHAFGPSGKLLAELCIIGYLVGTCITYFVVVGDLGPQIVEKIFALETGHQHLRTIVMFVVTILCILPLGMLRNVDSLSTLCTASIGFYVCLVIKIILESESHIVANDWTKKVLYWEPAGVLQCLPIFSMALSCQMQLFEVFGSINNQSLEKLNGIVRNATWICTFVYIAVGFFGYVAFCTQTFAGNILINLSPSFGSDIIKIGFVLSIAFSFPLVIFPCRASIYSLLYRKGHTDSSSYIPEPRFRAITLFIVGLSLCFALMIPSVELIIGLVGSTIGVAICIMFPASSFRKIIKKDSTERMLAQFIFVSGFCLMILGTFANLNAIDEQSSGAHLEVANIVEESLFKPPTPMSSIDKAVEMELQLKKAEFLKKFEGENSANNLNQDIVQDDKPLQSQNNDKDMNAAKKLPEPPLPMDESHNKIEEQPTLNEELSINLKPEKVKNTNDKEPTKNALQAELVKEAEIAKSASEDAQPMPPLPVAENHEAAKSLVSVDLKPVELPKAQPETLSQKNNNTLEKGSRILIEQPSMAARLQANQTVQQSIDKAAIKKEEDIVAEEQKESKDKDDELKKTRNELKKTKELLERTVGELKEELAKQNQETQHLVAEKLSEVVEKVEQIEKKVQKDAPSKEQLFSSPQPPLAKVETATKLDHAGPQPAPLNADEQRRPKGSLLNILADSVHAREEQEAHAGVYEPLSYKTGEKMNNNSRHKLDSRLPIPLALQRNVSEVNAAEVVANPAKEIVKEENTANETVAKDNVDAIRRDLLQLKSVSDTEVTNPSASVESAQLRVRREASEEISDTVASAKQANVNCLSEPKLDKPLSGLMEAAMQIESIGRELKSFREEDGKENGQT